jgi:hypothetical protein
MSVLDLTTAGPSQGGRPADEFLIFPLPVRRHDH